MGTSFVARVMAWWLGLFFKKRGDTPSPAERATQAVHTQRLGTHRVIPAGVDREAYRKVMRAATKMQRKIDAGTMTEEQALKALGVEL